MLPDSGFTLFADCRCLVAEGPLWNAREQVLYWLDVSNGVVYRKPGSGSGFIDEFESFNLNLGKIGGMVFTSGNTLLLFAAAGKVWHWSPGVKPELYAELPEAADSRFNDVIAAPNGNVFCGVMPVQSGDCGSLWRMDSVGGFVCIEAETKGVPNGMGFSPDLRHFYFTVSDERVIYSYEYDEKTGLVSGRTRFIEVPDCEGMPDGMTIDSEGCVWSAQWGGNRLVRYSPAGKKLLEYRFDIEKFSCIAFGGSDYSEIYVTTANYPWNETDYETSKAGGVFKLRQTVRGKPEFIYRLVKP